MEWFNFDIASIPRQKNFPFQVKMLYVCNELYLDRKSHMVPEDTFEVNIRLSAEELLCNDVINNEVQNEPYPNVIFKHPGTIWQGSGRKRDTIAFAYPAKTLEKFKELGMYPEKHCKSFAMSSEIEVLILRFRKLRTQLYSPGVSDQIDWTCFQLLRELLWAGDQSNTLRDDSEKIKNISVWLQIHLTENFSMEDIARTNGFSRASFFRKWKEFFNISPTQYLLDLKIITAERLLVETHLTTGEIIREINFSCPSAFYKRFEAKHGITPDEFRKQNRLI